MNEDDQQLVDDLRLRLPPALERLMDRYGNRVYGLVSRILEGVGRSEDVEECVSDIFLAAWSRIDEFDTAKGSLRTWLLILAKYSSLDTRRKLLRRPGEDQFDDRMTDKASVEETVISKEASTDMIALVNALPEPDRTIFYRRYFYYESVEQISKGLKLTSKAVENRLYRLRKMFKAKHSEGRQE
ncbi:sigma-70 family RNA polymerase sigma factor [Paenibacillus terrigena]|uniref:sigma-70 family RNA polymerase sigma factor n=1 Tax=Paenibacillus terrigena TaxID=369333 RepID=UPI000374531A|nr:sigma-70 family RNA polymerase sigma factor [Paenibacillus terrigena]